MNLLQLKETIEWFESTGKDLEKIEAVIPVELGFATVGGKPYKNIAAAQLGFDWDNNKLFLNPECKLSVTNEDGDALSRKQYDTIGRLQYEMTGLKKQIKDLKATVGRLNAKDDHD